MMSNPAILATTRVILGLLAEGQYEILARITHGQRLSAFEIEAVVTQYGRTLVSAPDEWTPDESEFIEIAGHPERRIGLTTDLWTAEEGRSDLSIVLMFLDEGNGLWGVQIDSIRVL